MWHEMNSDIWFSSGNPEQSRGTYGRRKFVVILLWLIWSTLVCHQFCFEDWAFLMWPLSTLSIKTSVLGTQWWTGVLRCVSVSVINKVPKISKLHYILPLFLVSKCVNGLQKLVLLEKCLEVQDRVSKLNWLKVIEKYLR